MRYLFFVAAIALTGCAGRPMTTVESSSERTVVVESIFEDVGKAQVLADVECAKHRRLARLTGPARNYKLIYDCVH